MFFREEAKVLLLDEADKMSTKCYSVLLGLMETGFDIETKKAKFGMRM